MKDEKKTRLKRQLLSGGIYIALAAAVVGVTTSTVAKLISTSEIDLPDANTNSTKYTELNNMTKVPELPEINISDLNGSEVSGTSEGINAEIITETSEDNSDTTQLSQASQADTSSPLAESLSADSTANEASIGSTVSKTLDETSVEQEKDFGYPGYVKPCGGFISKEYSNDVLVYSPTMYDYRTHTGIDIAADIGTPVKAVAGGTVTDISIDDMYGMTVTISSPDGLTLRYCNLSDQIVKGIEAGCIVKTGDVIGGIGETALCECAEAPHLHLEASKDGASFNPAELFEEVNEAESAAAITSTETD